MNPHAFASDNVAGFCPEAWTTLAAANAAGPVGSYGDDPFTAEACDLIRQVFETDCDVFFVFNGTAANSLALQTLCLPYQAVICHELAHLETDEAGAPEFFTGGAKLLTRPGPLAKLTPEAVESALANRHDFHFSKPSALSLTQATELGTVYQLDEIRNLTATARGHGLRVHMDGARFANAAATLGCSPAEMTWRAGVDVLSLGGTKLGSGIGDALVFFDKALARDFAWRCKQAGQLASKMRFLSAPWTGLLRDGAWRRIAERANGLARELRAGLEAEGVEILFPTEANAVFARFRPEVQKYLHEKDWHFYSIAGCGDARLMCSWQTTPGDLEIFLTDVRKAG